MINRRWVFCDLPTSAFLHEYRAFHAERQFDPDEYEGIDLVDYVLTAYELDRSKIARPYLEAPLTPRLLPDADAWRVRAVDADAPDSSCESPASSSGASGFGE